MLAPDTLPCPAAGLVPCAVDFRIGTDA
jgi:hypothetical protein